MKKKYRVIEYWNKKISKICYKPQVLERFLFWTYWKNIKGYGYIEKEYAIDEIEDYSKKINSVNKVVYNTEL